MSGCENNPATPQKDPFTRNFFPDWEPTYMGTQDAPDPLTSGTDQEQPTEISKPPLLLRNLKQHHPSASDLRSSVTGTSLLTLSQGSQPSQLDATAESIHFLVSQAYELSPRNFSLQKKLRKIFIVAFFPYNFFLGIYLCL